MNDMTQLGLGVFALAALNILIPGKPDRNDLQRER